MSADQTAAIAERLRLTREAKQMNQATFCRLVRIGQQAWNNYERGRQRITIDQALRVCTGTGVDLDWIYRGLTDSLPMEIGLAIQELQRKKASR